MGKISPVAAKYIVHAGIEIDGVVDRPDVIGAIFGQTEGLLGNDLELRELQRSGRIGRIEVDVETKGGKSRGIILIPSSLDKAETAIIAAALEIIQRIGPCNAKIKTSKIEDVRVSKRQFVVHRAKELLKLLIDNSMPDSQELSDEVAYSVRVMEITEYGKDRLPAGPALQESDEIVIVEGRADVLNLLKHGVKNAIAINGTSVPPTIAALPKKKIVTAFLDGDRGGDLILKELMAVGDIDFVARAPDGKEVEEITKKEVHKALRSKVSAEQAELDASRSSNKKSSQQRSQNGRQSQHRRSERSPNRNDRRDFSPRKSSSPQLSADDKKVFKTMLEELIGTKGACILDSKLKVLGKVPLSELTSTVRSMKAGIHSIVFDGVIDKEIAQVADQARVQYLVAMDTKVRPQPGKVKMITIDSL